jgi:hypothetical protein
VGPFFDPDKPGVLRKQWRVPFLVFAVLLGLPWAGYEYYVNTFPRTVVTGCVHVALMLLTVPWGVAGLIAYERRSKRVQAANPAIIEAGRRSKRIGLIGIVLLLCGAGAGYLGSEYYGSTISERGVIALFAGIFFVPGFLLIFYSQSIDHTLAFLPAYLNGRELEERVKKKTSLGNFARNFLLFAAAMGLLLAVLWYFPGIMEYDSRVITGAILIPVVLWIIWNVRRDRIDRVAHVSAQVLQSSSNPVTAPPVEPIGKLNIVQYALLAAGFIWVFAASDFIPGSASAPLRYVPLGGLVVCFVLAGAMRIYGSLRGGR